MKTLRVFVFIFSGMVQEKLVNTIVVGCKVVGTRIYHQISFPPASEIYTSVQVSSPTLDLGLMALSRAPGRLLGAPCTGLDSWARDEMWKKAA